MKNNYRVLGTIKYKTSGEIVRRLTILNTKSKKKAIKVAQEYRNILISVFDNNSVNTYVEVYQLKDNYEYAIAFFTN